MCIRKPRMKRRQPDEGSKKQQQQQQRQPKDPKRPRAAPAAIAFGPYLADRQWATLREDLSSDGSCWQFCDFQRSHRDPYLAGEDGLFGVSDERCRLCFAWGLWNGFDPLVKEKLFGVTGGGAAQGNHGEDVKEVYFYQLHSPDHAYMRAKYMYPSGCAFPYERLLQENGRRSQQEDEFEVTDTGVFEMGYWEVTVEYARVEEDAGAAGDDDEAAAGDTVCLLTAKNCSDSQRTLHVLPTVWFRNTWSTAYAADPQQQSGSSSSSSCRKRPTKPQPLITRVATDPGSVECRHPELPDLFVHFDGEGGAGGEDNEDTVPASQVLFTRNEAGEKDAISRFLVGKPEERPALPEHGGTKCSSQHLLTVPPGQSKRVAVRLSGRHRRRQPAASSPASSASSAVVARQRRAAETFYAGALEWLPPGQSELAEVCRLAYSGLLWSKQYYEYRVAHFHRCRMLLQPQQPKQPQPPARLFRWNPSGWEHLDNADIMSMPDKWEFPWYASWDTSFHVAVLVDIDPQFAKDQIELLLSDRFMTPEGQIPGCEFNYSDENPPVLAWAAHEIWRATGDTEFAGRVYPRLKRNFNWWLQHRRVESMAEPATGEDGAQAEAGVYFKSGFLGMDNICAFDRSQVPDGCRLYQADAFAWVFSTGLHCLRLALATGQPGPEVAFWLDWLARLQRGFRHVDTGGDGFCCDILEQRVGGSWERRFVRIKSMVGLLPLTAVLGFSWQQLAVSHAAALQASGLRVERGGGDRCLVSLLDLGQWMRLFGRHLFPPGLPDEAACVDDDDEGFLGPYGVRMLSRWHRRHPLTLHLGGADWTLNYEPGESRTSMYGGNSNWRGPVWLCMNYLLAQAALRVHESGGARRPELRRFARLVCQRVLAIFLADNAAESRRPVHGSCRLFNGGPWASAEFALLFEYFHGDSGRGCGASHQTGWTALVVKFAEMLHTRLLAA